jgi:hypothetical protein
MRGCVFVCAVLSLFMTFGTSAWGENNLLGLDTNPGADATPNPSFHNHSFENPAVTGPVSLSARPWVLSGPRVLQNLGPPFGIVPITIGAGTFINPATIPAGRITNADGNQLGYIFSTTFNDAITGLPVDHAFTQWTSIPLEGGKKYGLHMGVAKAQASPSPDSVFTLSMFAYDGSSAVDPMNPPTETLLASRSLTIADVNGLMLTDFDATTLNAIGGSNIGKAIGIRIRTQSNPSATPVQTSFDFDTVGVYAPEPASTSILGGVAIFLFGTRRRSR